MIKTLLVYLTRCTNCEACVDVCSGVKCGVYSLRESRIRIKKNEELAIFIPLVCEQCREHPCSDVCPEKDIVYDPNLSIFVVDGDICTSCGSCEEVCPYQGIFVEERTALKCDLCGGDPQCVTVCYPRALRYVEVGTDSVHQDLLFKAVKLEHIEGGDHG